MGLNKDIFTQYGFPYPGDPVYAIPPTVRILMLTDDDGSFSEEHKFGLTELIDTLESTTSVFANFTVTRAHRDTATTSKPWPQNADIQGFRFNNPGHFDPADYDEVWLIGILETAFGSVTGLNDVELRILSQFMDGGGGVFATGDHEDLGGALSARIPRVRSMRKWDFDYDQIAESYEDFNPASGDGPPVAGSFRHDTLIKGHNNVFTFDDQSDDIPAKIIPKIYGYGNKYLAVSYPHPLLCGPRGIIDVLPDHMHEGECIAPTDLTKSTTFDGYTSPEYPTVDSVQPEPDVVAHGIVTAHATDNTGEGFIVDVASKATTFGAVCAYDGDLANVGRVVTGSTFHHYVNINLTGAGSNSSDPVKQQGYYASPAGLEQYEQIKAYHRNVAIWLARRTQRSRMFNRTLWAARWDSQLRMLKPRFGDRVNWNDVMTYGSAVRSTMSRFVTPCMSLDFVFAQDNPLAKFSWWIKLTLPDPPPYERLFAVRSEILLAYLAAVMSELVRAAPTRESRFPEQLDKELSTLSRTAWKNTLGRTTREFERNAADTRKFLDRVGQQV